MQIKSIFTSSLLVLATCSHVHARNIPKPLPEDFQLEQRATHTEQTRDLPLFDTVKRDVIDIVARSAAITTRRTADIITSSSGGDNDNDSDDAAAVNVVDAGDGKDTQVDTIDREEPHVLAARLIKTAPGQSPVGIDNGIPSLLALSGIIIGVYGMLIFVSWDEVA